MNRKGLPLILAGCAMLFATAVNELIIDLLQYAGFLGLLGGITLSGYLNLNYVIVSVFRVISLLLVVIGVVQVLRDKTA